jgi:hypothetical protein
MPAKIIFLWARYYRARAFAPPQAAQLSVPPYNIISLQKELANNLTGRGPWNNSLNSAI